MSENGTFDVEVRETLVDPVELPPVEEDKDDTEDCWRCGCWVVVGAMKCPDCGSCMDCS